MDELSIKLRIRVLPLSLAAQAESVTEIPLALTPDLRGKELDLATLLRVAGEAVTYTVIADRPERIHRLLEADGYPCGLLGLRSAVAGPCFRDNLQELKEEKNGHTRRNEV